MKLSTYRDFLSSPNRIDEFWGMVEKLGNESGCWIFPGNSTRFGYGVVTMGGRKVKRRTMVAHVISFLIHNGEFDPELFVCHKCDTPSCVNPSHLFLGTHDQNMADMTLKNRQAYGERGGRAKLSEEKVLEAMSLHGSGLSHRQISEKYRVSKACITHALSGRNWKHIK